MSTATQIQREAPDIEARKLGLIDTAKALTEKGYTLPDYLLAQLTPEQQQARCSTTSNNARTKFSRRYYWSTNNGTT